MKEKVVATYEDGLSTVEITNRYGTFVGHAKLHPEDVAFESNFAGCRFAEMKAGIKIFQAKIKDVRVKIKTLEDFEKVLINCKDYDPNSFEGKRLRKQIYLLKRELNQLLANKTSLSSKLKEHIDYRDKVVHKYAKVKKD